MKITVIKRLTSVDIGKFVLMTQGQGTLVGFTVGDMAIGLLNLDGRIRTYSVSETTKFLVKG